VSLTPTPPRLRPLDPPLCLVLVEPEIPPNTGNIARTCAVTGCRLILVGPLGFFIEDKDLKRAGLDYWDKVFLARHASYPDYLLAHPDARRHLFSGLGGRSLFETEFRPGDHLVFGSESRGLPPAVLEGGSGERVCIPMQGERRGLNLATAAGIATYEALRQLSTRGG
jgi:tRNA (cytidine/uridine-2'-O-)-methyltransferase